ncbi:MAG: Leucinerich repeat protein-like protein [Flavipsychrobacter sp.]|jgi:sugar lactone lactonase YvrE|nr:Leucinerich repeat protein-like protein [Flavipsychrobacter sp.]
MKKRYLSKLIIAAVYLAAIVIATISHAQTISTFAGNGTGALAGDGGAATAASLRFPYNISIDGAGNKYIADWGNHVIRKITPSGTITRFAGTGVPAFGGNGGPATAALLNQPADIAFDGSGNLYFSDNGNNMIRKIDGSGTITTIVGTGSPGSGGDGGAATAATITYPRGIAFDPAGNLYFADAANEVIRKVTASGIISRVAGNGTAGMAGDGGPATAAQLNYPQDVICDASGNLYIADKDNHKVRMVTPAGIISTFAGVGASGFTGDGGPASAAHLFYPSGLYIDTYGNMYVGDGGNNRVRKIKPSGIISTVAGTGTYGFSGDGGPATAATMKSPNGTAKDASGNLYICDEGNHRVRKVTPTPITLSGSGTVCVGSTATLTASETGGTWTSGITGYATVGSSSGIVTGVAAGIVNITYVESGITSIKTITVNSLPSPITGTFTVCVGASTHLTSSSGGGAWASSSPSIGSVDPLGNVTGVSAGTTVITYMVIPSMCQTIAVVTVDPCSTTSVNEQSTPGGVTVYPNPAGGQFNMTIPANTTMIQVIDNLGRIVVSKNIETTLSPSISFTADILPSGQYIIKTFTREQVYTNKLVITR